MASDEYEIDPSRIVNVEDLPEPDRSIFTAMFSGRMDIAVELTRQANSKDGAFTRRRKHYQDVKQPKPFAVEVKRRKLTASKRPST